jgi:hypothetical protein
MQTYFLGPFLALLPKRWRESLPESFSVQWKRATVLSGLAESVLALTAMVYWYSYSMATWVERAMASAPAGKIPASANEQEIGFAAVVIFAMHPLTWLIGYFSMEGAVRLLGAAISENILGILPLYLLDRAAVKIIGRRAGITSPPDRENYFAVAGGAMREKLLIARLPMVPDELLVTRNATEEMLEIRSCRPKEDWVPPRVVRYGDSYYRLEGNSKGTNSRPFAYILRRLPAGVRGRTVLLYQPEMEPVIAKP